MQKQTREEFYKDWDSYCFFKNPKNGFPLMTKEEYDYYVQFEMYKDEHEAEIEAENAWLRHAENQVDYGFEQWEHSRLYS